MLPSVSILICTRDRAQALRRTLARIADTHCPPVAAIELVVVDNGSTDHTRSVVEEACLPFPVRYVVESRPGAARARNTAMAAARHDIFLWTDDDTRVPRHWIEPMIAPIVNGEAHIVAGGVRLAPHLRRPWMAPWHKSLLASTEFRFDHRPLEDVVGANMAFARSVLQYVPEFDPELGPGALGLSEESHFVKRLCQLGYRIAPALEVIVEHHFHPSRLTHRSMVSALTGLGRSQAYIQYHWWQEDPIFEESTARTRLRIAVLEAKYAFRRVLRGASGPEGMETWESFYVRRLAYLRQSLIERRRPRRYTKCGARRLQVSAPFRRCEVESVPSPLTNNAASPNTRLLSPVQRPAYGVIVQTSGSLPSPERA
jgi:glycosyltransferase involved in cell wall biosynthesis